MYKWYNEKQRNKQTSIKEKYHEDLAKKNIA